MAITPQTWTISYQSCHISGKSIRQKCIVWTRQKPALLIYNRVWPSSIFYIYMDGIIIKLCNIINRFYDLSPLSRTNLITILEQCVVLCCHYISVLRTFRKNIEKISVCNLKATRQCFIFAKFNPACLRF